MMVSVTFRNAEGEAWQREYVEEKLKKLKKYIDNPVDAHVVLSVEKFRNVAEINLSANGLGVNAKEEAKDMPSAIDTAIEKIERQLKKHKEKIRGHKSVNSKEEGPSAPRSAADETDDALDAKIAESRKIVLNPMTVDDAVMGMESTKSRFIVYRDSSSGRVSIIYRRDDGKYGLLETNG